MANKHFTTNDQRAQREREARTRRAQRKQRENERRQLLALQRSFDLRSGRAVA